MRTRKMTDRMLLEGLVNKYGVKRLTNVINEMASPKAITIYADYVVDDSMQLRKDIMCFRKNNIKAKYDKNAEYDNMEFTAISNQAKYALTDYMLNYYNDGDIDMIEEYWPELLPFINDCEGSFNNCF